MPTETSGMRCRTIALERRSARELSYRQFLNGYVMQNRPVIITDLARDWRALETWTPEFFKSRFGSRLVDVTYGVKARLGETIDAILQSTVERPGPYLHKVIIHQHMPELLSDLAPQHIYGYPLRYSSPLMPGLWRRPDGYLKLLIGGVGGKFPLLHFDTDNANALITEIYGEKEFVLFSPGDTRYLSVSPSSRHTSPINDLDSPDPGKFPDF
ncbi:MAG: cupin-like domain-containing protein, partial [Acidobacteriia bacterium]|nr:cupin-like domain-containing protein [Terriglobia bacterium]